MRRFLFIVDFLLGLAALAVAAFLIARTLAAQSPAAMVNSHVMPAGPIAAGSYHSLFLLGDGSVWTWGTNGWGQLGNGTFDERHQLGEASLDERHTPTKVNGLNHVTGIAANYLHSLAVQGDGSVWAWGDNTYGELGDGTTTNRSTPMQVSGF